MHATYDLIAPTSVWAYHDGAKPPEPGWQGRDYNDSKWKSGRGLFGFGTGDEVTSLASDGEEKPESVTAYFRRDFTVEAPAAARSLLLGLTCADGAAVYLNGQEIFRANLPAGAKHKDNAPAAASDRGLMCRFSELDAKGLCAGKNVIAVEVHRHNGQASGMRFDLNLSLRPKEK